MNDSTAVLDATPDPTPSSERALFSKIARLPGDLREQINQRLYDGQGGSEVLAWLNDLPPVKAILAAQFEGKPVLSQNLSHWRQTGYQRWLRHKENVSSIKELSQYAAGLTQAGAGHLAPAAAAIASGKILEFLDTADTVPADPNNLVKCAAAASVLLKMEQNNDRIQIAQQRLRQHEMTLRLKRDKQQRDAIAIARRVLGDARAEAIEASSWSNAEKIEALGIHVFGDLWEPRPVPVTAPSSPDPSAQRPRLTHP